MTKTINVNKVLTVLNVAPAKFQIGLCGLRVRGPLHVPAHRLELNNGPQQFAEISARYRRFAEEEARGRSPLYEQLANGVADDQEMFAFLATLPQDNNSLTCCLVRHGTCSACLVAGTSFVKGSWPFRLRPHPDAGAFHPDQRAGPICNATAHFGAATAAVGSH